MKLLCYFVTLSEVEMEEKKLTNFEEKQQETEQTDLYITNVPYGWTDDALKHYFAKFKPRRANILKDHTRGFVNFYNHQHAFAALTQLNNKRPFQLAMPLRMKFAERCSMKRGVRGIGSNHDFFWKDGIDKNGHCKKERDLNKLQQLIIKNPENAMFRYEYSCGLQSLLDTESKRISNPNLVRLWLEHINIAINLSKKQNNWNKPSFPYIMRKINFCIVIYQTNSNCHNIDIEDLLEFTWNAVTNYNRYCFYLSYVRLLHTAQREEFVTESLKLYKEVWNGNERRRYFQKYQDFVYFVECMIENGCKLNEIMNVMMECWTYYYNEYGVDLTKFKKQKPHQKTATFHLFLMVLIFSRYICSEYDWRVDRKILFQCIKWIEMTIELRPYYGGHYIHLSYCYFFVFNDYIKAREIMEIAVKNVGNSSIIDSLMNNIEKCTKNEAKNEKKWTMFSKWLQSKILKLDIDNKENEYINCHATPMMGDGGNIEPGSKFINITPY